METTPPGDKIAGIDLGEVHMAVSHDGEDTHILNGRLLRSKVQYRNKLQAKLNSRIDGRMKKGSRRRKRVIRSKKRQLKKIEHQIREIEHKQTTHLITTLHQAGVRTLLIGDVRDLRLQLDVGHTNNQKIHQWSHGSVRLKLTYKAQRLGMEVFLQEEAYTSRTCPRCQHVRSKVQGRVFRCANKLCRFVFHRDGVGAINIRRKYLGHGPVVGVMAPPTGLRFRPQARVAREKREAAPLKRRRSVTITSVGWIMLFFVHGWGWGVSGGGAKGVSSAASLASRLPFCYPGRGTGQDQEQQRIERKEAPSST